MDTQNMPQGQSPRPLVAKQTLSGMNFPEAIKAVIEGKRVTRLEWNNSEEYGCVKNGFLTIHTKGNDHTWSVSEGDLLAVDWVVITQAEKAVS